LRELLVRRFRHSAVWCQWAILRRLRLRTAPGFRAGCATSAFRSHVMCKTPAYAGLRLVRPVLVRCAREAAAPCCLAAVKLAPRQGPQNYGRRWGFKRPSLMGRGPMLLGRARSRRRRPAQLRLRVFRKSPGPMAGPGRPGSEARSPKIEVKGHGHPPDTRTFRKRTEGETSSSTGADEGSPTELYPSHPVNLGWDGRGIPLSCISPRRARPSAPHRRTRSTQRAGDRKAYYFAGTSFSAHLI
jgi:hypothetical protein